MTHAQTSNPIHWFRHSLPYINTHRGKTFVVMITGEAIAHANFAILVQDLALLHSLGIRLVLVHGARVQLNEALAKAGLLEETPFFDGVRITPVVAMPVVLAAVGQLTLKIQGEFSKGLANTPLFGAKISTITGNFVSAKPFGVRDGVDFMQTGEVRRIDDVAIRRSLDNHHIVIISCIGFSATGELFNLDAQDVATHVAVCIGADKLIFLDKALTDAEGRLIRELTIEDAKAHESPVLNNAFYACEQGVARVQLIDFDKKDALLGELFTTDGTGTLISLHAYDHIRGASVDDILGIVALIRPLEAQGILVVRHEADIERDIDAYFVIERDGRIIGCACLYDLGEDAAEIASIAIDVKYRSGKRGESLLAFIENEAKNRGKRRLFALTTRTLHWFIEHGFHETAPDELPAQRYEKWHNGRNSKVLLKHI